MREGYQKVRDKGNFVKMIFGFNESCTKLSHQLETQVKGVTSITLTPSLPIY